MNNTIKKIDNLSSMSQAVVRDIDDSRRFERAVMFTDISGFTSLIKSEEQKTIQKLEAHRKQLELLHEIHEGRIIQYYGDGSLSVFESPVKAVECAVAIQKNVQRLALPLKIGIHLGDVVEKGAAVYGDGVNVASRIESIGVADSILFSEGIWKEIKDRGFHAKSLGMLRFKNVTTPLKVYGLLEENLVVPDKNHLEGKLADVRNRKAKWYVAGIMTLFIIAMAVLMKKNFTLNALLENDITTVGVMPFRTDGIATVDAELRAGLLENLVSNLSSFYGLQVLSPRATETYDHSDLQPMAIGTELGVSHLLYVTMRPASHDSIRIHMELVSTQNGRSTWTKTIQTSEENLFAYPNSVPEDLAKFLKARENPYESRDDHQGRSRPTLSSYRLLMEARTEAGLETRAGLTNAITLLELAIERDSSFALGYALLSQYYSQMHIFGLMSADEALEKAESYGGQSFMHDRNLSEAYVSNALMNYAFFLTQPQEILELLQHAVQLKPSSDYSYFLMGKIYFDLSDFEMAENYFGLASKLNPEEHLYRHMVARSIESAGGEIQARKVLRKVVSKFPERTMDHLALIKMNARMGHLDEAKEDLDLIPGSVNKLKVQAYISILEKDFATAERLIRQIKDGYPNEEIASLSLQLFDGQGKIREAWVTMDAALEGRQIWLKEIKQMNLSETITNDPRFENLCQKIMIDQVLVE